MASEPASAPDTGTSPQPPSSEEVEKRVWQELRQCFDPEIPVNIVELGLVYGMRAEPLPDGGHRVEVLMTVTSPACGMSEILRDEAEARIAGLPGVKETAVTITFDPPWTPELMSAEARMMLNL